MSVTTSARLMPPLPDPVDILRRATAEIVRRDAEDLSARQMGILLTVYLTDGPHTVRGLAGELAVPKPSISRAIDRLVALGLVLRAADPRDRRSVVITRTRKGSDYVRGLRGILDAAKVAAEVNAR